MTPLPTMNVEVLLIKKSYSHLIMKNVFPPVHLLYNCDPEEHINLIKLKPIKHHSKYCRSKNGTKIK